jgi:hypothetical protein
MPRPQAPSQISRHADAVYVAVVAAGYLTATTIAVIVLHPGANRLMVLADRIAQGHLDSPAFAHTVDTVLVGGRYVLAVGPMQVVPYLPFVPVPVLQAYAPYVAGVVPGLLAAWLALPLARAYGAAGSTAYWVATFTAFGTLLFYVSVFGDLYYLAHAESILGLTIFLIEWAGRRRPAILGLAFALSILARPTTVLAVVPFAIALLRDPGRRWAKAWAFALPIALGAGIYAAWNWARFGSAIETGYGISYITEPSLIARRALGVFSLAHVPENLRLALVQGLGSRARPPYRAPDPHGLSMLLVSPGLLISLRAGFREALQRQLWIAAALVAVPVFLYYGGGYVQYGFRYSLDFTPFLVALVALGTRGRFGRLERALIVASVASVTFGVLWHAQVL